MLLLRMMSAKRVRGEVLVCYKEEHSVLNYTEYMNMVKDMEEILKYEI